MNSNKGFTLVEMLAVVIIIMVIFGLYKGSHDKGMEVRRNETARARLIELANAARLHNEIHPTEKVAGTFGTALGGYLDPCFLFEGYPENANPSRMDLKESMAAYALNPRTWGYTKNTINANCSAASFRTKYQYDFYLCNPDFESAQPSNSGCDTDTFAVLVSPATGVGSAFNGKKAYLRRDGTLDISAYSI